MDPIHQPVTLFMPTDDAMSALAQEQKDFLYAMHNRDKLSEYLRYHILRDTKLLTSELIYASSLKTQHCSDLSVACMGEEQVGELYVNHKGCRIVKRYLDFNGGMIYGIDCLLNPPSLGGRCDHKQTIDFTLACRRCGSSIMDCPLGSKPVCKCKTGYIGDGFSCTGNLMQVLSATPTLSNFLSQILNYSTSASGKAFVNRLCNITIQSTLFVPDNDGLYSNQTLSGRDIEHHLLDGRALILQALINVTHVRTRLGSSLTITGVPDLQNPQKMTSSGYINDQYVIDSNIFASNGVIHVLQGPLKAPPPPPPSFHPAHQAGMGIGVLGLIILIVVAGFVGYNFYTHKTKPFQFHYFKEDEGEDVIPSESSPNISNPVYDAAPATKEQPPTEEDKHQVISSGTFDLLQDS
ncbi:stabilin-2-like [Danio aesculapii]|uniref:stabilin-2-like n=1 Tax=Danio aesculapii TaxID=1142201 RepID=UPI0024BFA87C|nr:stabilin-2-like [Danio aesculapii]